MTPPADLDYSKWDKLELSDDEDLHPGAQFIEANTLRRIKRESQQNKASKSTRKNQRIRENYQRNEEKD